MTLTLQPRPLDPSSVMVGARPVHLHSVRHVALRYKNGRWQSVTLWAPDRVIVKAGRGDVDGIVRWIDAVAVPHLVRVALAELTTTGVLWIADVSLVRDGLRVKKGPVVPWDRVHSAVLNGGDVVVLATGPTGPVTLATVKVTRQNAVLLPSLVAHCREWLLTGVAPTTTAAAVEPEHLDDEWADAPDARSAAARLDAAIAHLAAGQPDAGEDALRDAIAAAKVERDRVTSVSGRCWLGEHLVEQARLDEARPILAGVARLKAADPEIGEYVRQARRVLTDIGR